MEWENLYEYEREKYRERAKAMIESGQYENFEVEELAVIFFNAHSNEE